MAILVNLFFGPLAVSDGEDYVGRSEAVVVFPAGSFTGDRECITIDIINDERFEKDDESFNVSIADLEEGAIPIGSSASVIILDDEGQQIVRISSIQSDTKARTSLMVVSFSFLNARSLQGRLTLFSPSPPSGVCELC